MFFIFFFSRDPLSQNYFPLHAGINKRPSIKPQCEENNLVMTRPQKKHFLGNMGSFVLRSTGWFQTRRVGSEMEMSAWVSKLEAAPLKFVKNRKKFTNFYFSGNSLGPGCRDKAALSRPCHCDGAGVLSPQGLLHKYVMGSKKTLQAFWQNNRGMDRLHWHQSAPQSTSFGSWTIENDFAMGTRKLWKTTTKRQFMKEKTFLLWFTNN